MDFTDDLRLAHLMADNADSITMARFKAQDLRVTAKPDLSNVTDADVAVEESCRRTLATARPRDAIHGEEFDDTGWGPRRWIIDPIDGTSNFVRGVPVWASLIALMVENEVVAGVVSAPALGRRWWASRGAGAYVGKSLHKATRIGVSQVGDIADASLSYSSLHGWVDSGKGQHFVDLMRSVWRTRAYGDFWSYVLVAEGAVDIAAEPELSLHDMAAPSIVVAEAGGRFTSVEGTPGPRGPGAVATNGLLHDLVVEQLTAGGAVDPEAPRRRPENDEGGQPASASPGDRPQPHGLGEVPEGCGKLGDPGPGDIGDHITQLPAGGEGLAVDIHLVIGDLLVHPGEDAGHVLMQVQQAYAHPVVDLSLRQIDRHHGRPGIVEVGQLVGDEEADVLLRLGGRAADMRGENHIRDALQHRAERIAIGLRSLGKTSTAAPAICPERRLSRSASWSTTKPRARLRNRLRGRIIANSAPRRCRHCPAGHRHAG